MIDEHLRRQVRSLLDAVRERPAELPILELADLSREGVNVTIDRQGPEPVAFVEPRPDPRFDGLSTREYEVATLVAAGYSNRQIADALFISLATVKDHVHAVLVKTALSSRSEVAACWYGRR